MPQKISPFVEGKYGWNFGESGWNIGMDENLLKFSYLFDSNIDAIVSILPSGANGVAYFLTTDNRVYFYINGSYFSTPVPKWYILYIKATGVAWQFDGTQLNQVVNQDGSAILRQDLQSSTGANLVKYGTRTIGERLLETVNVLDFGADPTGVLDSTSAYSAAVAYAKTKQYCYFLQPPGKYLISSRVTFDLPNYSTLDFRGEFTTSISGSSAIRLGSSSSNIFGLKVMGLNISRTSNDTTSGSIGVEVNNLVFSTIEVRKCQGFQDGVFFFATQPNGGISYCNIQLGFIHDNRYNVRLVASGSGYVNENTFYGGSFNHSSNYPTDVDTYNIHIISGVAHPLNNNRFMFPSLEDNNANAIAARVEGLNNSIIMPRLENPANLTGYPIILATNSQECFVEGAYGLNFSNIQDYGLYNTVQCKEGFRIKSQRSGGAVIEVQNLASSSSTLIEGKDSAGTSTSSITGLGVGTFSSLVSSNFLSKSNSAGIYFGSGSPEGIITATVGSLYLNTTGTTPTTVLYVKTSGSSATGWTAK